MVNLGDKVRDQVTGFTGVVIGKARYLTGCNTVGIQAPVDKEGKLIDAQWFDEQRIEALPNTEPLRFVPVVPETVAPPGGPQPTPQRDPNPIR
jgi:hypothetical protein